MKFLTRPGEGPSFPYAGQPVHVLAGYDGQPSGFAAMEIAIPAGFSGPPSPLPAPGVWRALPRALSRCAQSAVGGWEGGGAVEIGVERVTGAPGASGQWGVRKKPKEARGSSWPRAAMQWGWGATRASSACASRRPSRWKNCC